MAWCQGHPHVDIVLFTCFFNFLALGDPVDGRAALIRLSGDAACLDGSPGAYYLQRALRAAEARRWVVFLEGGGECVDEASCGERSLGDLGSSKGYKARVELTQLASRDPAENPDLWGWNHVLVKYCTGDLHLGDMPASAPKHWGWARFTGAKIVRAVLDDLSAEHDLENAEILVWTGASAGGIGSIAHLDAVAQRFPRVRVVGAPIAGYYWDNARPYEGPGSMPFVPFGADSFKEYASLWNMFLPERCALGPYKLTPWVCALADFSFSTIVSPMFVVEALIDKVQLSLHAGIDSCTNSAAELQYCVDWGATMTARLQQVASRARTNTSTAGLFSPACFMHTRFGAASPKIGSRNYVQAFGDWLLRPAAGRSSVSEDRCCDADVVAWNPTCGRAELASTVAGGAGDQLIVL